MLVDQLRVCPLMDPLIAQRRKEAYTYVVIGRVTGPEAIPSVQVPHKLNWIEFAFSLLFFERGDLTDYRFVAQIYTLQICLPKRHRRLHALRTFLIARYFALKFRNVAEVCDSAHVLVFYNAIMLGVVRAFRRLGKSVWDVQHGYLGPDHDAYNNVSAYSLNSSFRPNGFLVWDRHFGEYLEARFRVRWKSTDYLHLKSFSLPIAQMRECTTVLYSLQWETPVPAEVAAAVRRLEGVRWLLRMHPFDRSPRKDLDLMRDLPNVTVARSDDPLHNALRACDLHLTYNSSVVHEAAVLGIPSLFLDPACIVRFAHEIDKGFAQFVPEGGLTKVLTQVLPGVRLVSDAVPLTREDVR